MKKVLFLIVVMFVTISLNAQVGVNVGPKIGYQASKLSFQKGDVKTAFVNDLNVGLFTRFTFEKFILQPELLLSCQNINKKVNNLSLPVLFGIKIVDNKNFKMRANVGPVAYFTVGRMRLMLSLLISEQLSVSDLIFGDLLSISITVSD